MTKTARVISIIFLAFLSFFFTPAVSAGFSDLLRPIPEDSSPPTADYQPASPALPSGRPAGGPSVTFGDLLKNASPKVLGDQTEVAAKTARFKQLLAQLEKSYQATLADFQAKAQTNPQNIPYMLGHLTPTPFIPVPALIANVNDIAAYLKTENTPYPTPTISDHLLVASLNNPSPTTQPANDIGALTQNPIKTTYTIALLGDSMTDTLGKSLPQLRGLLQSAYPNYSFALLNYGQGATDLESGLYRFTNTTNYLGASYPPLLSYKPDILVVESFAYNHWGGEKYDLDRQWLDYAKIADTVRQNSPQTKIVFAATVAPNKDIFGDGSLNWPAALKENSAIIIKAYLQNLINFATSQHYPLADAYHPSLGADNNGQPQYINGGDHLHPSSEGALLYSQKIFEAIKNNQLIP